MMTLIMTIIIKPCPSLPVVNGQTLGALPTIVTLGVKVQDQMRPLLFDLYCE